jgi:hypothetical protein
LFHYWKGQYSICEIVDLQKVHQARNKSPSVGKDVVDNTTVVEKIVNAGPIEIEGSVETVTVFQVAENVVSTENTAVVGRIVEKAPITVVENDSNVAVDKTVEDAQKIEGMVEPVDAVPIEINVRHRSVEMLDKVLNTNRANERWGLNLA